MIPRAREYVFVAAAILSGAGCDVVVHPIEVAPGCPSQPLRGPTAVNGSFPGQLIDDFEFVVDGGIYEPLPRIAGRDGQWDYGWDLYGNVQGSHGQSNECVGRGNWSGHFMLTSTTGWGANWTAVFMAANSKGDATPYDAHYWGGISFWAAFGGRNGSDFAVPVGVTTIDNAWNGRVCSGACQDFYGTTVPLTHEWRRYEIRFDDLEQAGWGVPQVAMRREQMVGFIIQPSVAQTQYDIWIDDVRFEQ